MVMVAGTVAAGDELDKLTWIPPGGASPSQKPAKQPTSRSMMPSMSAPPVPFCGNNWNGVSFSFGGKIVIVVLTDAPLKEAVTVTGVGVVTKPTRMPLIEFGNPVGATSTSTDVLPAGMTREAGSSGKRFGLLAVSVTVAPPAGAGPVISTEPRASPPLNFGVGNVTAPIRSGVANTVNVPVAENAVYAGSMPMYPCWERTRQNFVPVVNADTISEFSVTEKEASI